eukprot:241100-Prorocentrum_minimum.AAC.1
MNVAYSPPRPRLRSPQAAEDSEEIGDSPGAGAAFNAWSSGGGYAPAAASTTRAGHYPAPAPAA